MYISQVSDERSQDHWSSGLTFGFIDEVLEFCIMLCFLCLQMASTYMKSDDVSTLYISQARQLEEQGKFKEAEK